MSVQSEIDRIITAIGNAYSKVSEKGGTVPASQTVANLAPAIDSIPSGDMKASVYDPQGKAQDIFAYVEGLATSAKAKLFSVTIPASGWSGNAQTVSNDMLKAAGFGYIYNPDEASYGAYVSAMVRCGEVTVDGQVTFYCDDTPTDNITVDFMRIEVNDNV